MKRGHLSILQCINFIVMLSYLKQITKNCNFTARAYQGNHDVSVTAKVNELLGFLMNPGWISSICRSVY